MATANQPSPATTPQLPGAFPATGNAAPASSNPTKGSMYSYIEPELGASLSNSLQHIVNNSVNYVYDEQPDASSQSAAATHPDAVHSHGKQATSWIAEFFPNPETVDRLFAYEDMGCYVVDRETGKKVLESMPLYVRVGMHLLFVEGAEFMGYKSVEGLLTEQSVKQGAVYDKTGKTVLPHIQSFVKAYSIPMDELLIPDLKQYPTFNSFFARKLLATARPIASLDDPTVVTSPADCRLSVFESVESAKQLWIKGQEFTIPKLLLGDDTSDTRFESVLKENSFALAVCRLAPQDYHRFHSPFNGVIIDVKNYAGELYTVNPQDLNVFTRNKRSVMLINAFLGPGKEAVPVAFVAIGAMMVGSIGWTNKPGDTVTKGQELGWFQYGGSTTIMVVPSSSGLQFNKDLLATSQMKMETLVRVGTEIARIV